MDNRIVRNVVGGLVFGLLFTFGLILVFFEILGITDVVLPVLWSILSETFVISLIFIVIILVIIQFAPEGPADSQVQMPSTPEDMTSEPAPTYSSGAVRTVPVYCPYCSHILELDKVDWVDGGLLRCPACGSRIDTEIREML